VLYRASVSRSKDDRYLFFGSYSSTTSEVHFVPADRPTQALRVVQPRMEGLEYSVEHMDGRFGRTGGP
jgi:oligopeptidase B